MPYRELVKLQAKLAHVPSVTKVWCRAPYKQKPIFSCVHIMFSPEQIPKVNEDISLVLLIICSFVSANIAFEIYVRSSQCSQCA